jgi:hypothetical protein
MPRLKCQECNSEVLVLGFDPSGPKRCPTCGARWTSPDPSPDLFRMSRAAIEAKRAMARTGRFRRTGPRVAR